MESLSRAYVQAVAAQAGLNYSVHAYDYGIDITLREIVDVGGRYIDSGMLIDVQLKSTTQVIEFETEIKYDLDVRTYDHLRSESAKTLRVLVVLALPAEESEWLTQSVEALCLRRCAYWLVLRGAPATEASSTVRITIPVGNVLTESALQDLIRRPVEGGSS
ncbi:MAG TPA: DUF4365 domain-containing protein [Gemmataceae bacterium]|nr:DUF4365 domain-containing protein [Gemmataceae bacterium]